MLIFEEHMKNVSRWQLLCQILNSLIFVNLCKDFGIKIREKVDIKVVRKTRSKCLNN